MRTANPALNDEAFKGFTGRVAADEPMTIQGTVNKTLLLLICALLTAGWTWNIFLRTNDPASVMPWVAVGAIGGFILALVTIFKQSWAPVTSPLYALLQGLFLGGVSSVAESQYPGIVIQAVGLTFGTCLALLVAYKSGLIRATENFKLGVVAATGGIALVYLASIVLSLFGINMPGIFDNGLIGIGFSLFVVTIAALNLVLDFDFIESGSKNNLPKYMEWYGAFGLMVTLIWLYIEILRLLIKLRSRD
ncbi:MAG: Bax inhibitor-1/YccA family protein [Deltaproteobacteria bacterium]|nr:Bax inhibitor-1/YccA family protein [Deltaproteobacteria bacterium]